MNRPAPMARVLAGRLIAHEAGRKKSAGTNPAVVSPVAEKLRPHLATFMGNAGFRALLSRALALPGTEVHWLRSVRVNPDGSLAVTDELKAQATPGEIHEGGVVLIARLLGLMVAFIGEKLTLRLVRDVWPKLSLKDLNPGKGDKHEKTK